MQYHLEIQAALWEILLEKVNLEAVSQTAWV